MDDFTATEIAYKNGYNQALKDFTERVKEEIGFNCTLVDVYETIDQIAKEMGVEL